MAVRDASRHFHGSRPLTDHLPQIYLARHGETAWTITGQHTGITDLPLTQRGERNARSLGVRLRGIRVDAVYSSPLIRARQTCSLSGYGDNAIIDADLEEWDYGDFEGRTTASIHKEFPEWYSFRDGFPGGESLDQVYARASRVVDKFRERGCDVLVFSHGHFLRFVAAAWLGLAHTEARFFLLTTASLSVLGYEHTLHQPVIRLWNDDRHVGL